MASTLGTFVEDRFPESAVRRAFLGLAGIALLKLRWDAQERAKRLVRSERNPPLCGPVDERIERCIREELAPVKPVYILDVGAGFGHRARALSKAFGCVVVAMESSPAVSHAASLVTEKLAMDDHVWHVRLDDQLAVDPQDVIEGQCYDAIILSAPFSSRKAALAWAAIALREGGVLIVEGTPGVYNFMKTELGLDRVAMYKGGMHASLEVIDEYRRKCITTHQPICANDALFHPPEPYILFYGIRTGSQSPMRVRPRTLSAVTFAPPSSRSRRGSSLGASTVFEKVRVERVIHPDGLKRRVECICMHRDPRGGLDIKRTLVVSSSKRVGEWIIPGGHVEANEEPEAAAEREALEEAGVRGRIEAYLTSDKRGGTRTDFYLLAIDEICDEFQEAEHRQVYLIHVDDIINSVFRQGVRNALKLAKEKVVNSGLS